MPDGVIALPDKKYEGNLFLTDGVGIKFVTKTDPETLRKLLAGHRQDGMFEFDGITDMGNPVIFSFRDEYVIGLTIRPQPALATK